MDDFKRRVDEMHTDVKELVKQGVVHNELLRTHEARSLALQEGQTRLDVRLEPVEKHVYLVSTALKAIGLIFIGVAIQYFIKKLT